MWAATGSYLRTSRLAMTVYRSYATTMAWGHEALGWRAESSNTPKIEQREAGKAATRRILTMHSYCLVATFLFRLVTTQDSR